MRLRADGNEQVHLLGPQGGHLDGLRWVGGRQLARQPHTWEKIFPGIQILFFSHALHPVFSPGTTSDLLRLGHVVTWTTPSVLVSDLGPESGPCFEVRCALERVKKLEELKVLMSCIHMRFKLLPQDDMIAVTPLWSGKNRAEAGGGQRGAQAATSSSSTSSESDSQQPDPTTSESDLSDTESASTSASSDSSQGLPKRPQASTQQPERRRQTTPQEEQALWLQTPKRKRNPDRDVVASAGRRFEKVATQSRVSVYRDEAGCQPNSEQSALHSDPTLLGWLVWVKSSDELLLICELETEESAQALRAHPIVAQLPAARTRLCLLMLGPGLSARPSSILHSLMDALPGSVLAAPWPSRSCQPSSTASARVSARLALASRLFFPLPWGLRDEEESSDADECLPKVSWVVASSLCSWQGAKVRLGPLLLPRKTARQVQSEALEDRPALVSELEALHHRCPELMPRRGAPSAPPSAPPPGKHPSPPSNKSAAALRRARLAAPAQTAPDPPEDAPVCTSACVRQVVSPPDSRDAPPHPLSVPGPLLQFLGTGCAEPSKYRAASAILLRCVRHGGLAPPCQLLGTGRYS